MSAQFFEVIQTCCSFTITQRCLGMKLCLLQDGILCYICTLVSECAKALPGEDSHIKRDGDAHQTFFKGSQRGTKIILFCGCGLKLRGTVPIQDNTITYTDFFLHNTPKGSMKAPTVDCLRLNTL